LGSGDEDECPDCEGTGIVDIDIGGGNTVRGFCVCELGREKAEKAEMARDEEIDRKIDERIEQGRSRRKL